MPSPAQLRDRRRPCTRLEAGWRRRLLAAGLLVGALTLGACSSTTPDTRAGPTTATAVPATNALLTRLATEGSDTVFEQRFGGELDAGGEAGPLVFAGRSGDQAVLYACDGATGTWFTGTVDDRGAGTLRSGDGQASVRSVPVDDGLGVTFEGGDFDGRTATAAPLEVGEGQLVRLEATAAAGGAAAAVGGIIVSPSGVRGVLRTSITDGSSNTLVIGEGSTTPTTRGGTPSTTAGITGGSSDSIIAAAGSTTTTAGITDGNSNTVIIGEGPSTTTTKPPTTTAGITDGNSNTVIIGEGPTTTTTNGAPLADGGSSGAGSTPGTRPSNGTTIVSRTPGGLLTVQLLGPSSATTATASTAVGCAAKVAVLDDVLGSMRGAQANLQRRLELLRRQRDAVADQAATAGGADQAGLQKKLDQLDGTVAKVQRQLDHVAAQMNELARERGSCAPPSSASR